MTPDSKRKEDWIQITKPDGRKMIASPSFIKKLLRLEDRGVLLAGMFTRLERLENKVEHLEAPERQGKIYKLLDLHGKHNRIWIENRVFNCQWYDFVQLQEAGLIIMSKSGTVTMYSCKAGS